MLYRFKTEQEFINEFGKDWRYTNNKNGIRFVNNMDYLLGTKFKYKTTLKFLMGNDYICIPSNPPRTDDNWYIDINFLIKIKPTYNTKILI